LVPAERSDPERVLAEMLGNDVGCAVAPGKHVTEDVGTDASGENGGGTCASEPHRAGQTHRIRPVPQARACDWHTFGHQLLEIDAAAIERHHAHVEAAFGKPGGQECPLPLCSARLQVGAYEHDLPVAVVSDRTRSQTTRGDPIR